jgi:UTP--glucose-1-phosphate uridylyltransferase
MTKAIPKEMLCLVDRPLIQYGVEEAMKAGFKEVVFITGRGKSAIEEYFDFSPDFEQLLRRKGMRQALGEIKRVADGIHFCYTRQRDPRGLGHAILCAKNLIGKEAFAVLLGDEVILSRQPVISQLSRVYQQFGGTVVAVQRVNKGELSSYGVIAGRPLGQGVHKVEDLVEKPSPAKAPSRLAIVGRYVLSPAIFEAIARTKAGKNREIQLTDALKLLAREEPVFALEIKGDRYDAGNVMGLLKANLSLALKRPEFRREMHHYLAQLGLTSHAANINRPRGDSGGS